MKIFIGITILVIGGLIGFFVGQWFGERNADSALQDSFVLIEDMVLLDEANKPFGTLPAGTVIYCVPDPWGDKTMAFKLFLFIDVDDDFPVKKTDKSKYKYLRTFSLKSQKWLKLYKADERKSENLQ